MVSKRLFGAALMTAIALPLVQGCSSDNPLCCTEFKVGGTIEGGIGGSAQSQVAVQAVADFAGIAAVALEDVTTACRGIAEDLDAPAADRAAAEKQTDRKAKMDAYCKLAVSAIGSVKAEAGGSIEIVFQPPKCEASVSAKANCQAKCSGSAQCDVKANPPKCTGGKLQVACKGGCTAEAGATLACEGSCTGECSGACTAEGGVSVECNGKCEGECKAGGSAGGNGIQADGSCKGTCSGTCTASAQAPAVKCSGSCKGSCNAKCEAKAGASVKCDGKCEGDFEPLKCEGGKLEGGCKVEAKCDANCDASVQAKAECSPPAVTVAAKGAVKAEAFGKLKGALEANLGVILSFEARAKAMVELGGQFTGNIKAVTDIKASCIPPVVAAVGTAVGDLTASVQATGSVVASVK